MSARTYYQADLTPAQRRVMIGLKRAPVHFRNGAWRARWSGPPIAARTLACLIGAGLARPGPPDAAQITLTDHGRALAAGMRGAS